MADEGGIVRYKAWRQFEEDEREAKLAKTKETIVPPSSPSKNPHKAPHTPPPAAEPPDEDKYEAKFNGIRFGFLKMQKVLVSVFDPCTAYYLSALLEWRKFLKDNKRYMLRSDGSFFILQGRITKYYFLSIQRQKTARQKLERSGVLVVRREKGKGRTKANYYKIDFERLWSLIDPKVLKRQDQWKRY